MLSMFCFLAEPHTPSLPVNHHFNKYQISPTPGSVLCGHPAAGQSPTALPSVLQCLFAPKLPKMLGISIFYYFYPKSTNKVVLGMSCTLKTGAGSM